jgi:uncharacterized membrane-anchored protein
MIYFLALSAIIAVVGLAAMAAATQTVLSIFGLALFAFGVGFAFFLIKNHFDRADAARH